MADAGTTRRVTRRQSIFATVALALAPGWALGSESRTFRLGIFVAAGGRIHPEVQAAWLDRLASRGFVEGSNLELHVVPQWQGDASRLEAAIAEMLRWKPDAVITQSTFNTRVVQRATRSVPIIFFDVADPISAGFVKSFAAPGGNITGVSVHNLTLFPKRLQFIRELLPKARKVGLIVDSTFKRDGFPPAFYQDMRDAAATLSLELVEEDVSQSPGGFPEAFQKLAPMKPDIVMPLGPWPSLRITGLPSDPLPALQSHYRIPVIGFQPRVGGPLDGLLVQLGADLAEMTPAVADRVEKVFRGANPAEIPVYQQSRIVLVINLKVARELGVAIPKDILTRADRVIE